MPARGHLRDLLLATGEGEVEITHLRRLQRSRFEGKQEKKEGRP
jgi:hypothetical protein